MTTLIFFAVLVTVAQSRVTFTHSEVLQQTDLDGAKSAKFKCDNGCLVYSDSQSANMYINDGTRDVNSFQAIGPAQKPVPTELGPSKDYKIVYRGTGAPPRFVFYAVDKKSPNLDTTVYAVDVEHGYMALAAGSRRFTVLNSDDAGVFVTFDGDFAPGYPRIYATGYDASSEGACKAVYQARSQESATNSYVTISSPVLTVEKGPAFSKAQMYQKSYQVMVNSSVVYMSPGYIGCSYTQNQAYYTSKNSLKDTFSTAAKSIDLEASLNIPKANEAVHITVNSEKVDLTGSSPIRKHFDANQFDVAISWTGTSSNFAVQFDLGVENGWKSDDVDDVQTTTKSVRGVVSLLPLLTLVCIALW